MDPAHPRGVDPANGTWQELGVTLETRPGCHLLAFGLRRVFPRGNPKLCDLSLTTFEADTRSQAKGLYDSSSQPRSTLAVSRPRLKLIRMKPALYVFVMLGAAVLVDAGDSTAVSSPDGRVEVQTNAEPSVGRTDFQVRFRGRALVEGALGLSVRGTNLLDNAAVRTSRLRSSDRTYTVPFGKSNPIRDHFNELTLELEPRDGTIRKLRVVFRVYDDGVAFRCVVPAQEGVDSIEITDEPTRLRFPGNPQTWPLYRENYTTSHEGLYGSTKCSELDTNRLIDLPFLTEFEDGVSVAMTEASLRNYAGMYLKAEGNGDGRRLRCDLSPLPGQTEVKVRSRLPLASPWRVLLIGTEAGRLIESNLLLSLNDPPSIEDTSWLKAGKTTWYWWNGPYQEPVDFAVGLNWPTMKHYIDFCARNGIAFHAIMSTTDEHPWYQQSDRGFGPGPDTDITKPRAGLSMEQVGDYARTKGVGLRLWVHWKPLSQHLEEAFAQYERWGIQGLMVDFLDRDDQEMVLFAERVLQSAARHHLHIHFHGVWKPTGLQRTFPNLLNHEGVLNLEYLKWSDQGGPPHNVMAAYTRMLAGPLDYHLGGFRSVNRDQFKPVSTKPNVLGTRCHHLALYVVYENPMPMVSDAPSAYEGQPGFDFICRVPTTWDETRVLQGKVGSYIVLARRKGADWYVGALTDWTARTLEMPLTFLRPGQYRIETWADVPGSEDPNQLTFETGTMDAQGTLQLRLSSGGGAALHIRPVTE